MSSRPFRAASALCLCVLVSSLSGCTDPGPKTGTVAGSVSLGGAPLASGVVTFEDPKHGRGGSAPIRDGAYAFPAPLDVGDYRVVIQPPPPPPPPTASEAPAPATAIPPRYQRADTSGLSAPVKEGQNTFDFKLE